MPDLDLINNNLPDLPDFLTPSEIKFIQKYQEYVSKNKLRAPDTPFLINLRKQLDSITQEQIDETRKKVLEYLDKNRSQYKISDRFIKELTLDNYLRGYIARDHKNPVERIVETMEFLSQTDDLNDEKFPKELLEFGLNASTGFDVYGNPVFYLFARRNFIPRKLFNATEKYIIYVIYQLVRVSLFTNGKL